MQTDILSRPRLVPAAAMVPLFAATLFLSAGLMFLVEPMIARIVLPRLGGSPAVWSTCLLFFQAVLLLGYAYAHLLNRIASRSSRMLVHAGLVLPLAALALPLDFGSGVPPPDASPALWLLSRLALVAGPPVFVISATAPLLQSWFAELDHDAASDPYFLYGASNAGSVLALLAYPFLVEPALPLVRQTAMWSLGYGALALCIVLCAGATIYSGRNHPGIEPVVAVAPPSARDRVIWTALAFVPSSLLLGVTSHITADIAAAPLLWVAPLILYLASFIVVFARRPRPPHAFMARILPLFIIPLVIVGMPGVPIALPLPVLLGLHLTCFFAVAMVCHGELARRRPEAARLTEFYFFLSLGGVLGGVFNALVAPLIFPDVWEYPLALVAACVLRPCANDRNGWPWDIVLPIMLLGFILLSRRFLPAAATEGARMPILMIAFGYVVPAMSLLNFSARRWRFALGVGVCLFALSAESSDGTLATFRSFFGVYRINVIDQGSAHQLTNGITVHGAESLLPGEADIPMGYYSREGPFGAFFAAAPEGSIHRVAVIGLGAGALACYAGKGQEWTFYEIDPLAEQIARDTRYFHYLADCGTARVVLGDARMTIAGAPAGTYDVLVVDAFSSDSIPMHLLTREALALYFSKLAPEGTLLFHISSRSLDLRPVLSALAADAGVQSRISMFGGASHGSEGWRSSPAWVVAMAAPGSELKSLDHWTELPPAGTRSLWTDQRSDLLAAIRFGF